jgi:hypothetical protein
MSSNLRLDNRLAAVFLFKLSGSVIVIGILSARPSPSTHRWFLVDAIFVYVENVRPSLLQKFSGILRAEMNFLCLGTSNGCHGYST